MVYLDYNATTPTDPDVLKTMIPVFSEDFGNPSSENHKTGMTANDLIENARKSVASIVGMKPADVIFTSGATEANNMVFFGYSINKGIPPCMLVGATEHKSVLEPCEFIGRQGGDIQKIPVAPDGTLDLHALKSALSDRDVDIVSAMAANSETGVIHPIKDVVRIAHENDAYVHCDATQAVGRIPFDAGELGVDFVTFSSHKLYGPKGCGALVATRNARSEIRAMIYGGGQENNMRSGTPNVPGIVGFGRACEIAPKRRESDAAVQQDLRKYLEEKITSEIPDITINGAGAKRLPNTSNMRLHGAFADAVIVNAPDLEISTGSACASNTMEPSHVLTAMGLDTDAANESVRISVGRNTSRDDIDAAIESIRRAVQFVRGKELEMESIK